VTEENREMFNGGGLKEAREQQNNGGNMELDYLKPKSPFPLSWKMLSQANW
jgi:hypothetical protein